MLILPPPGRIARGFRLQNWRYFGQVALMPTVLDFQEILGQRPVTDVGNLASRKMSHLI